MDELIKKINNFAKLAKSRSLTESEIIERNNLRQEYLKIFKKNFENQLKSIKIVNPNEEKK
ncbi:DUF896 domain-containing protein [Spiroplasma turonicum]|nr:DUF896 domain-containing protein [Spiroplasma turonicum]